MSYETQRRGGTLIELVLTLVLFGIVAAIAIPSLRTTIDEMSVRGAQQDLVLGLWAARSTASIRGDYASFVVDASKGRFRVVSGSDTVFARDLAARRGVTLTVSRDSITYAPTGIGWGAANTTILVSRGHRSATITTSRLGRVAF